MRNEPRWVPEIVRARIKAAKIVTRLQAHVRGKIQMTSTQIKAAEILLRKTVPDLSAIEHSGAVDMRTTRDMTDAELLAIASSEGTPGPSPLAQKPGEVH